MKHTFHVRFDNFDFESDRGIFHESGIKINLKPKELAVLALLVQRHGKLVTKEQLIDTVWNGAIVSDESIARSISVIKSRLREASPGAEQLIKTEYGRGYRFIGAVSSCTKNQLHDANKEKKVSDIASRDILHCNASTTVLEAAQLLHQHRKSSIIINDHGHAIGIWTEADALALDLTDPSLFDTYISSVMHSPVITIQEWKPLSDAVLLMRSKGIRHLLVVDKAAQTSGVISQTDLVRSHGVESFLTLKDVKSVVYKRPLLITHNMQVADVVHEMRLKQTEIAIIQLADNDMYSFTERDLMGLIAKKQLHIMVSELDHKPLVSVTEDMSLFSARQLMDIQHIRHLAVVDAKGDLLKVLSLSDILQVIEHSYVRLLEEILEQNKQTISENEDHIHMLTNAVQQTAGMILITDKYGNLEYVNKAFETISGYTLDEVKGLNPRFLKSGNISAIDYQQLWKTLLSGQTWKGELCNRTKSGGTYWVLASIAPIYDESGELNRFVAVEEDITDRIKMEKQLREVEQRFHDMANASPVMFWESDANGKLFYFSQFWFDFTGRQHEELKGNKWAQFIHPEDITAYLDIFQYALVERKEFAIEYKFKNAAGDYRWVMNAAKPRLNDSGIFLGFMGYSIDITDRKNLELAAQAAG